MYTFAKGEGWTPLRLQDVEANDTILVYVGMVNTRHELDCWRLKRIVCWKPNIHEKDSTLIRTSILLQSFLLHLYGSNNDCLPMEYVSSRSWTSSAICRRVMCHFMEFLRKICGRYQYPLYALHGVVFGHHCVNFIYLMIIICACAQFIRQFINRHSL